MKIKIINKQGCGIAGLLSLSKKKKLIIICNGYNSTKEFSSIKLLAEGLNKKGYDVFRFDFSGTGESGGPKKIFIKQQVDDLDSVVNYFKNYKDIIIFGGSLGALSAAIVSVKNPRVSYLITVNGFFGSYEVGKKVRKIYFLYRLASLLKREFKNDYKFFKDSLIPEKIKAPVLVIYTKNDDVVSPIQSERFYSKLTSSKNKKLLPLQLIKHNLTGKDDVNKVVSSIDQRLIQSSLSV